MVDSNDEKSMDDLHPVINLIGIVAPMAFGGFGMLAVLGRFTSILPYLEVFTKIALVSLGLFLFGAVLVYLQVRLDPNISGSV